MTLYGLPHSEISGSSPACGSPKLFAAYRVLLRLLAPRHPPYALPNLTFSSASPSGSAFPILSDPFVSSGILPSFVLCFAMQFSKIHLYFQRKTSRNQKIGGDERDRTADPLLARQVLSQLSYTPTVPGSILIEPLKQF